MINKKYFAKYLPEEGEIKFKDLKFGLKVATPSEYGRGYIANHNHTEDSVMVIYNMEEEGYYKLSELKLLKLFLCSRDIQVGDKVRHTVSGEEVLWTDMDTEFRSVEMYFKVIGEISPDALSYVKEGDEFDEKDVKLVVFGTNAGPISSYYEIKCPCCGDFK